MTCVKINQNEYEITLTRDELYIVHRSIAEVRNEFGVSEFATRIGATIEEADAVSALLIGVVRDIPTSRT